MTTPIISELAELDQSLTPEQRFLAFHLAECDGWTPSLNPPPHVWLAYFTAAKAMASRTELLFSLERLLACPDLNLEELEAESAAAIFEAKRLVEKPRTAEGDNRAERYGCQPLEAVNPK